MADDLGGVAARLERMATALGVEDLETVLTKLGVAAKEDATDALRGDLGDLSMSHWRRGRPIQLGARFDVSGSTVSITTERRGAGPWRVLEEGRRGGASTDLVLVGRVRKTGANAGTKRGKSRGRNQGRTVGKNTWTDAEKLIESRTPERALDALYTACVKRWT